MTDTLWDEIEAEADRLERIALGEIEDAWDDTDVAADADPDYC